MSSLLGAIFSCLFLFSFPQVMLLVGFFETFAAGWIFGLEEQVAACGAPAVVSYFCANFLSVIVACIVWFATDNDVST